MEGLHLILEFSSESESHKAILGELSAMGTLARKWSRSDHGRSLAQNRLDSGEEVIAVSDGREEREEEEKRREREKRKDREDWINRDLKDQWEPERDDS
jgi:hypothetical protein